MSNPATSQPGYTIFDKWADEGAAARAAQSKQTKPAVPTWHQLAALAVERVARELRGVEEARSRDTEWHDADAEIDLALRLVRERVAQLQSETFCTFDDFGYEWYPIIGALTLAVRCHSRPDSIHGIRLAASKEYAQTTLDLADYLNISVAELADAKAGVQS